MIISLQNDATKALIERLKLPQKWGSLNDAKAKISGRMCLDIILKNL